MEIIVNFNSTNVTKIPLFSPIYFLSLSLSPRSPTIILKLHVIPHLTIHIRSLSPPFFHSVFLSIFQSLPPLYQLLEIGHVVAVTSSPIPETLLHIAAVLATFVTIAVGKRPSYRLGICSASCKYAIADLNRQSQELATG